MLFRVPLPSEKEVEDVIREIALKEKFNIKNDQISKIKQKCERNLRRAILYLQHAYMTQNENQEYFENWKHCISKNIVGNLKIFI